MQKDQTHLHEENARLETRIDYLESEFLRLHERLKAYGFEEGLKTLGETLDETVDPSRLF